MITAMKEEKLTIMPGTAGARTNKKLGLSLSGGGYRAAAFHLGTLIQLHKMRLLEEVDVISTISGGSITGAYYCLHKDNFPVFAESLYAKLKNNNVIRKVLLSPSFFQLAAFTLLLLGPAFYFLFTPYAWLFPVLLSVFLFLLIRFQFTIFPVSKEVEKAYDDFFYEKRTLGSLPAHPTLVIGSTNLQTARPFTFSKYWMQDSSYQYRDNSIQFESKDFPLSRAVMASSCVPFAFTPVTIGKKYYWDKEEYGRVHPQLVDGGVYDNQGIHKIMVRGQYACDTVITSDAASGGTGGGTFRNTIALLIATVDVFMSRIKKAQMVQDVYDNAGTANKEIAYFSLAWDAEKCIPGFVDNLAKKQITSLVIEAHELKAEWVADAERYRQELIAHLEHRTGYHELNLPTPEEKMIARRVGTNLTALPKQQLDCLIKQAEALTELQVKLYCPNLIHRYAFTINHQNSQPY